MSMKKTVNLPSKLHQQLKIAAAKEGITIEALIAKTMWHSIGGVHHG